MSVPTNDEIARVAYAIWQAEGEPEGCGDEHWARAKRLLEEGRTEAEYPGSTAPRDGEDHAPRPVQPGFADAAPGITPVMKPNDDEDPPEEPGGRFAKQIDELPENPGDVAPDTPGPRNPEPIPPTNAEGYVAIPSVGDRTPGALSDNPAPPEPATQPKRRNAKSAAAGERAEKRPRA